MELNLSVNLTAEASLMFKRLHADMSQLSDDLARLKRFIESTQTERPAPAVLAAPAAPAVPAAAEPAPEPAASEPAAPEPAVPAAQQRQDVDAQNAARLMVKGFELMQRNQRQSVAKSLAYSLWVASDASAGFQCPTTIWAIMRALDGMDAAAKEA